MFFAPPYDHDHENEIVLFAETNFRNARRKFGIKTDDRRRHMYLIGKTGMGKSTVMENMLLSDIYAGHGVAYIDPHGDTVRRFLDFIPSHRINDVVYFNPGDSEYPIGFNILEQIEGDKKDDKKDLVANGLVGVFKKIWPDVWSPRMEHILNNTVRALLDAPGSTLLGINRLLVDKDYRKKVVSLIQDPVVKTFWAKEFAAWAEKYRTEAIAPVQNKVGQFLSSRTIRNVVAQVKSTIDMREVMDSRKILLVNLSKGIIGEENSRLLGAMIITRLQLAAMERVDIPREEDRQDFYLYVDEFQNFATDSFANILSEARKYRLNLIVAHQYIEQLDELVAAAVFGNVGTILSFRVGGADAVKMESEFMPQFTAEDLVNLQKYDAYLKLMIDGAASEPFSATTLPPISQRTGSEEKVIRVSRERYARNRTEVEEKVLRWSGIGTMDEGVIIGEEEDEEEGTSEQIAALQASSPKLGGPEVVPAQDKKLYEIACSVCGKVQKLTFEPDWSRPWYCKDHLEMRKQAKPLPPKMPIPDRRMESSRSPMMRPPSPPPPGPAIKPVSLGEMFGKKIDGAPGEMEVINEDADDDTGPGMAESAPPASALRTAPSPAQPRPPEQRMQVPSSLPLRTTPQNGGMRDEGRRRKRRRGRGGGGGGRPPPQGDPASGQPDSRPSGGKGTPSGGPPRSAPPPQAGEPLKF